MITFNNTGISSTPTKSGRALVYTDIIYNGETYHWAMYVPSLNGVTLGEYLNNNAAIYENDIVVKEALWLAIPHTEEVFNPMTGETEIRDIPKERIVCATIPDYEEVVSDPAFDIKSIKRLLIDLCNAVFTSPSSSQQQLNDLAVISDNYVVGKYYPIGSYFCYEGVLYNVLQTHTSQADWYPASTPSLYVKRIPVGTITVWVQPAGAYDAYQIGDKVTYNSKDWECNTANNVWEPGVFGWTDLTPIPENIWAAGIAVIVDSIWVYTPNGLSYKCLQAHTTQTGWEPPNVPALWEQQ
jgi:hypothetical protein